LAVNEEFELLERQEEFVGDGLFGLGEEFALDHEP
jgi:hypothetical protein